MAVGNKVFAPAVREKWGKQDGLAARAKGKLPLWARNVINAVHPDRVYGEAFWGAYRGENQFAALAA